MVNPNRFYTYAYLRKNRTPYYIGKGCGRRVYEKCRKYIKPPKDKSRIIFLKQNLTEEEAFKHEIYMIAVFGRKDLGTGILHNRTNGGEGVSGVIPWNKGLHHSEQTKQKIKYKRKFQVITEESRKKMSQYRKGRLLSEEHKRKIGESNKGKNKGKILSKEHKRKISNSLYNKKTTKLYKIIYPDGKCEFFDNISKFCRTYPELKIDNSALLKVSKGILNQHKGFSVILCEK
jgi:hypothetical protein